MKSNPWLRAPENEFSQYGNVDDWSVYRYEHVRRTRERCRRKHIRFDLDVEALIYPTECPILDIPITRKLKRDNYPSFDRVDSTKGYTNENVRIISHKANRMKQDNSIETLERLLQYMKGHTNVC